MGSIGFANSIKTEPTSTTGTSQPTSNPSPSPSNSNTIQLVPADPVEAIHGPLKKLDKASYAKLLFPHVREDGKIATGRIVCYQSEAKYKEGKPESDFPLSPAYEYLSKPESNELIINSSKGGNKIMAYRFGSAALLEAWKTRVSRAIELTLSLIHI